MFGQGVNESQVGLLSADARGGLEQLPEGALTTCVAITIGAEPGLFISLVVSLATTMRTPEHLARLKEAIATLPSETARATARKIDAVMEPFSVFWGTEDGEPYVEWGGSKPGEAPPPFVVRVYGF
jgi:hypothetical protein